MPDHDKIPLQKVIPRASPEAISLMEWMLQYNPKKRPRPSQILAHEFFSPKSLGSAQQKLTGSKDTTAETTSHSRVESLVIGANSIQLRTKVMEFNSPSQLSFQKSQHETPQKIAKKAINKSIEVAPTRLEPIIESSNVQDIENGSTVIFQTDGQIR